MFFILFYFIFPLISFESQAEEPLAAPLSSAQNEKPLNIEKVEKIKVTGSRIKRIDLEGPSPLTIWNKEDLDNSGYFSLSEFFENSSLSNFGGTQIHNRSTLVLVNGKRMVYDGDLDLVPISAIERVEVLRDGASALYGSDVVGGVVNIITKKDFSAPEISLKISPELYPFYKGGSQVDSTAYFGYQFEKGHFLSDWQFQYFDGLKASQRKKWYADYFYPYSPYPVFKVGGGSVIADPKCPESLRDTKDSQIIACRHSLLPYAYISPKSWSISSYNYAEYKLSEMTLYTQWFGFFQSSKEKDSPIIDDLELPQNHQMSAGRRSAGTLKYLFEEISSDELNRKLIMDGLVGLKGYLSKTWDYDFSFKWSSNVGRKIYTQVPYLKDLTQAVVSGAYDPFNPQKRDFSNIRLHDATYKDFDTRFFTSFDFSGESGFLDIDLAVGAQAYYNKYINKADPKVKKEEIFGLEAAETKDLPSRTLLAGYVEGVKSFSNNLEIQIAGRVDQYSDWLRSSKKKLKINSKWTANPKLAVYYKPISNLLIRSSVGSSFELPELSEIYTPETEGFIRIHDTVACYNELKEKGHFDPIYASFEPSEKKKDQERDQLIKEFLIEQSQVVESKKLSEKTKTAFKSLTSELGKQQYCKGPHSFKGTAKGNPDLKETKALTASLGFHYQLSKEHSLTADYWFNSLSGYPVNSLWRNKKTIDAELRHGKSYVSKKGVQYERDRDEPYNPIKEGSPVSTLINVGGKKLSGVDLKWESDFSNWINVWGGSFYFVNDFSYVIKAGVETFPGMGYINNLGKFGLPKWRNFAHFGYKNSKHNIYLVLKTVAGVKKSFNEFETLSMGYVADLFYHYKYDSKTSFRAGLHNVFFMDPVLDDSEQEWALFDQDFFESRGPHFFLELKRAL